MECKGMFMLLTRKRQKDHYAAHKKERQRLSPRLTQYVLLPQAPPGNMSLANNGHPSLPLLVTKGSEMSPSNAASTIGA